jgi:hypothetical protein
MKQQKTSKIQQKVNEVVAKLQGMVDERSESEDWWAKNKESREELFKALKGLTLLIKQAGQSLSEDDQDKRDVILQVNRQLKRYSGTVGQKTVAPVILNELPEWIKHIGNIPALLGSLPETKVDVFRDPVKLPIKPLSLKFSRRSMRFSIPELDLGPPPSHLSTRLGLFRSEILTDEQEQKLAVTKLSESSGPVNFVLYDTGYSRHRHHELNLLAKVEGENAGVWCCSLENQADLDLFIFSLKVFLCQKSCPLLPEKLNKDSKKTEQAIADLINHMRKKCLALQGKPDLSVTIDLNQFFPSELKGLALQHFFEKKRSVFTGRWQDQVHAIAEPKSQSTLKRKPVRREAVKPPVSKGRAAVKQVEEVLDRINGIAERLVNHNVSAQGSAPHDQQEKDYRALQQAINHADALIEQGIKDPFSLMLVCSRYGQLEPEIADLVEQGLITREKNGIGSFAVKVYSKMRTVRDFVNTVETGQRELERLKARHSHRDNASPRFGYKR